MHAFVTGPSGHAGSYVIPELIAAGYEVTGLARSDKSAAAVSAPPESGTNGLESAVDPSGAPESAASEAG